MRTCPLCSGECKFNDWTFLHPRNWICKQCGTEWEAVDLLEDEESGEGMILETVIVKDILYVAESIEPPAYPDTQHIWNLSASEACPACKSQNTCCVPVKDYALRPGEVAWYCTDCNTLWHWLCKGTVEGFLLKEKTDANIH